MSNSPANTEQRDHETTPAPTRPPAPRAPSPTLCPYCGHEQTASELCESCGGFFEPLSQQATQNAMGPWFIRDPEQPFHPGCSYATLRRLAERDRISLDTVLRGPTTHQFWSAARETPGVAHLLGQCHNCRARADADDYLCSSCGVVFAVSEDRQSLGLSPVRPLPGQAPAREIARAALGAERAMAPATAATPRASAAGRDRGPSPTPPASPKPLPASSATPVPESGEKRDRKGLVALLIATNAAAVGVAVVAMVVLALRPAPGPSVPPGRAASTPDAAPASPVAGEIAEPDGERLPEPEWEQAVRETLEGLDRDSVPALERAIARLRELREQAPPNLASDRLEELSDRIGRLRDRARDLAIAPFLSEPDETPTPQTTPEG